MLENLSNQGIWAWLLTALIAPYVLMELTAFVVVLVKKLSFLVSQETGTRKIRQRPRWNFRCGPCL